MVEVNFLQSSQVLHTLKCNLRDARHFRSAVAYLRNSGYGEIERDLISLLENGGQAELVVGLSVYGITDWECLDKLLRLKEKYGNLSVKYYYNEGFHPKLFIFEHPENVKRIVLGSSNLTGGGIRENVEANVLLEGKGPEKAIADIIGFFKKSCSLPAEELSHEIICKYRPLSERSRSKARSSKPSIRETPIGKPRESKTRRLSRKTRIAMFKFTYEALRLGQSYSAVCKALAEQFRIGKKSAGYFVWATKRWMTQKPTGSGEKPNWFEYLAREAGIQRQH